MTNVQITKLVMFVGPTCATGQNLRELGISLKRLCTSTTLVTGLCQLNIFQKRNQTF